MLSPPLLRSSRPNHLCDIVECVPVCSSVFCPLAKYSSSVAAATHIPVKVCLAGENTLTVTKRTPSRPRCRGRLLPQLQALVTGRPGVGGRVAARCGAY